MHGGNHNKGFNAILYCLNLALLLLGLLPQCATGTPWTTLFTGTTRNLRGVSFVDRCAAYRRSERRFCWHSN
eukprot:9504063-Pyramimonas_sp.AAC.4